MIKADLYTKIVLTIIALALVMIACNQYVHPDATVKAQGQLTGIQAFWSGSNNYAFFDSRTGEIWQYDQYDGKGGNGLLAMKWHLTKLGQPLVSEYDYHDAGKRK